MPQAELELQVPALDALADAVLRAGALLPDELQLLAHGAAVLALLVAVPLVGVVLSRARGALRRAAGAAVLLHVAPRRTLVTQQLARRPWVVMEILRGRVILDGPLNRNVQEHKRAAQELVHCGRWKKPQRAGNQAESQRQAPAAAYIPNIKDTIYI